MDSKELFTSRVDDYVRYRPSYPAAVLTVLEKAIGFDKSWVVADMGAGTGISTGLLLDHGNSVLAVEPNEAMRSAAERQHAGKPGFRSVSGSAEKTGLPDQSVDLVFAAQAFHWFEPQGAHREFRRILRHPPWVALVWNLRRSNDSEFMRDFESLVERFRIRTDYAARHSDNLFVDALDRFFSGRRQTYHLLSEQVLDLPALRGRLLSSSYAPPAGHAQHEPMMETLEVLFRRYQVGGSVNLVYDTDIHWGTLAPDMAAGARSS